MDANTPNAGSPAPSPAKGKPVASKKASGKGVAKKNTQKTTTAKRGGRGRGRGRNKKYDDPRVQAAYERQKELKDLFSEVAGAIKPALEELADQTIKKMLDDPDAHEFVPEFTQVQQRLDQHLAAATAAADKEYHTRVAIATRTHELNKICTQKQFEDAFNYETETFLDGALNRTSILAELREEGLSLNLPDTSYEYVEEPDDVVKEQGPYVVFRNGIKIPYPHLLDESRKPSAKGQTRKGRGKRKAEDQPDGQPGTKKTIKTDEVDQPRHIGGLLSAVNEPEGEPVSNAASPAAVNDEPSPGVEQKAEAEAAVIETDLQGIPAAASEPDAWGVRTMQKRPGQKVNNRLIVPPAFEFGKDEIGYRDSTNDPTRKATKATRGKWLNKPNSRFWHIDPTLWYYDCREYKDGELDPETIQKHKLHPKYGLFLPGSENHPEPRSESQIDNTRPVVIVTPNHSTLHASRTVRSKRVDIALEWDAKKESMTAMLNRYCEDEGISPDNIVTDAMRERQRLAAQRLITVSEPEVGAAEEEKPSRASTPGETLIKERVAQLLRAADYLEAESPIPPPPPPAQRPSRPYDAVRDVFTGRDPTPSPPSILGTDTTGLSFLADVAEQAPYQREYQYEPAEGPLGDDSMIDPRILGAPSHPSAPSNAFLQTALNPTTTYAPIAPAPPQALDVMNPGMGARNPFTHQRGLNGNAGLPPLRPQPQRTDQGLEGHQGPFAPSQPIPPLQHQPHEFGSPRGMIQTNSGGYYPPAPPRSYHHGLSIHEPTPIMPIPLQKVHQGAGSGFMPSQAPPLHPHSRFHMSPPAQGQAQLAPMPGHMVPGPSISPPGSLTARSPPGQGQRQRTLIPSNSSSNNPGKFRKIAAAPIAPNRVWSGNGNELRLNHYEYKDAIKDYSATEPPPRSGPTTIRGWNINNVSKGRNKAVKKEDSDEKESPANSITPFMNKWNPSEKS